MIPFDRAMKRAFQIFAVALVVLVAYAAWPLLGLKKLVDAVHRAAEGAGRDPSTIEITAGASPSPRTVDRLAAMGVHRMIWPVPTRDPKRVERQLTRAIAAVG